MNPKDSNTAKHILPVLGCNYRPMDTYQHIYRHTNPTHNLISHNFITQPIPSHNFQPNCTTHLITQISSPITLHKARTITVKPHYYIHPSTNIYKVTLNPSHCTLYFLGTLYVKCEHYTGAVQYFTILIIYCNIIWYLYVDNHIPYFNQNVS